MRILVIRFSSMGDVILVTPVLTYLRRTNPGATIWLATRQVYAGLFTSDNRVDHVVPIDAADPSLAVGRLAEQPWDWAIDLQDSRRSRQLLGSLARPACVTRIDKLHVKRMLLLLFRRSRYSPGDHVVRRYLQAAGSTEREMPVQGLSILPDPAHSSFVRQWLQSRLDPARPMMVLIPFSAWRNKQWPAESFAAVARSCIADGWSVAVAGGPEDVPEAHRLRDAVGAHCASTAGEMSLGQMAALMGRSSLALGNDTGLSHLARACGVRTAIVYGSTTWHWGFFPYGEPRFAVLQSDHWCRPCHPHGGDFCMRGGRPCLREITVDRVVKELRALATGERPTQV